MTDRPPNFVGARLPVQVQLPRPFPWVAFGSAESRDQSDCVGLGSSPITSLSRRAFFAQLEIHAYRKMLRVTGLLFACSR